MRLLLLLSLLLAGCGSTHIVDRTRDGTPILIRSSQPDEDDIRSLHKKYGLATVINLRGAEVPASSVDLRWNHGKQRAVQQTGGLTPDWWVKERKVCEELGISFWTLNLGDGTEPPDLASIRVFLLLIAKGRWPILIHCQGGIHRTGSMAALYRMQFQGWPAPTAIQEMESYWYNWSISDRSKVKEFLRYYRVRPYYKLPR